MMLWINTLKAIVAIVRNKKRKNRIALLSLWDYRSMEWVHKESVHSLPSLEHGIQHEEMSAMTQRRTKAKQRMAGTYCLSAEVTHECLH